MKNADVQHKQMMASYYRNEYIFPSGNISNVQGYEPLALDILLQIYSEDDILVDKNNKIVIPYW